MRVLLAVIRGYSALFLFRLSFHSCTNFSLIKSLMALVSIMAVIGIPSISTSVRNFLGLSLLSE